MPIDAVAEQKYQEWQQAGLARTRRALEWGQDVTVSHQGRDYLNFCSNDYLNLTSHPQVKQAFKDGVELFGVGSGASQYICGYQRPHAECEEEFAEFLGYERALLFSCGYMANQGVLTALSHSAQNRILQDQLNHASLLTAGQLAAGRLQRYAHVDVRDCEKQLRQNALATEQGHQFIVTDSVFSMRGDIAPVNHLAEIAKAHGATLIVDDAHGIGVLGDAGRGVLEHFNLSANDIDIIVCPLGKAFGCYGAIVAGCAALIEQIEQFARSLIYTTALPPALACAALASLKVVRQETWRREKLRELIQIFQAAAQERSLKFLPSITPIQNFCVGDTQKIMVISEKMLAHGFLLAPIRYPSVPKGEESLRITLNVNHKPGMIEKLLDCLQQC